MSRAYCLTCNEHVHETPSGTCPLGHPVAADGYGPEPWVGFAGDTGTEVAEVQMHHLDTHGRPREHAGVSNGTPHVNGRVNGAANGSANGHAGSLASSVAFPSVNGSDRPGPNDLASEDLTALLAEALRENAPDDQAPPPVEQAPAPLDDPARTPAPPASHDDDADWSELASLAAELHLDEEVATDDGPRAPAPPVAQAPEPFHAPHAPDGADTPADDLSADSIDDLLAELTGGTPDPAPTETDALFQPPHAPEPPQAPAPPVAPPPPPVAPPAPPAVPVDDDMGWDAPPPPEDVGSAPTADPVDIWADPAPEPTEAPEPAEEPTAAPTVDLYNFTARGKRVGDTGAALPARKKKRGRKR